MHSTLTTDALLAGLPLFEGLSQRLVERISRVATPIDVAPGRVLMRQGELGRDFILMLDGEVEVRRGDSVLAVQGAPDYVGEIALIEHCPRTATVTTTTPALIDVIDVGNFMALLADEPTIAERIRSTARQRLDAMETPGLVRTGNSSPEESDGFRLPSHARRAPGPRPGRLGLRQPRSLFQPGRGR